MFVTTVTKLQRMELNIAEFASQMQCRKTCFKEMALSPFLKRDAVFSSKRHRVDV
jgi:hypothetical protein